MSLINKRQRFKTDAATKACIICGTLLEKRRKKVCSLECRGIHFGNLYRGKGSSPYIKIWKRGKRIYLHRHVWETANGRKLKVGEIVHHINENKRDNRPENLQVLSGRAEHLRVHNYLRKNKP